MTAVEILDGIHRIDVEVGGRPLYLFLSIGEERDDPWEPDGAQELVYSLHGHAERLATGAGRNADGHVVHRACESP